MTPKHGWETLLQGNEASTRPRAKSPRGPNSETALQGAIIQALEAHGLWVTRIPAQGVRHQIAGRDVVKRSPLAGFPDLLVIGPEGTTAWLEVKTAKGRVSPLQRERLERLEKLGHVAAVVRSIDEALSVMRENAFIYCPIVDMKLRRLSEDVQVSPEIVET